MGQKRLFLFVTLLLVADSRRDLLSTDRDELFEKKVRPVLVERCHKCHAGPNVKGGLRLDSRLKRISLRNSG